MPPLMLRKSYYYLRLPFLGGAWTPLECRRELRLERAVIERAYCAHRWADLNRLLRGGDEPCPR